MIFCFVHNTIFMSSLLPSTFHSSSLHVRLVKYALLAWCSKQQLIIKNTGHYWLLSKTSFSHLVYRNIKQQTCENLNSIHGRRSCEIIMEKEKTPLSHEVVCFKVLYFETSNSNSEVPKSNSF